MAATGRRSGAALFLTLILAVSPARAATAPAAEGPAPPARVTAPGTVSPTRRIVRRLGARQLASLTPPQLSYYGGPVISSVRVVMVLYGSGVDSQVVARMPEFYRQMVNGPTLDWLCEYDTNIQDVYGRAGTQQVVRRGSFLTTVAIAPSPGRDGATITDTDVQNELAAQFAAAALPLPDSSTLYMVHFPPGKTIELDPQDLSCQQFCAYHGCFYDNGRPVRYAVLPDLTSGGCESGCGYGTGLAVTTQVAWHELAESITDPDTSLTWYDAGEYAPGFQWGEIADICDDMPTPDSVTVVAGDGVAYVIQTIWSNGQNHCADSGPACAPLAVQGDPGTPAALSLVSPSPIVGRAQFRVSLPGTCDAELALYDAAGRRIAELMRGVLGPGEHVVTWDPGAGGNAPRAGVYFARLHAGGQVRARTVIVLR